MWGQNKQSRKAAPSQEPPQKEAALVEGTSALKFNTIPHPSL